MEHFSCSGEQHFAQELLPFQPQRLKSHLKERCFIYSFISLKSLIRMNRLPDFLYDFTAAIMSSNGWYRQGEVIALWMSLMKKK